MMVPAPSPDMPGAVCRPPSQVRAGVTHNSLGRHPSTGSPASAADRYAASTRRCAMTATPRSGSGAYPRTYRVEEGPVRLDVGPHRQADLVVGQRQRVDPRWGWAGQHFRTPARLHVEWTGELVLEPGHTIAAEDLDPRVEPRLRTSCQMLVSCAWTPDAKDSDTEATSSTPSWPAWFSVRPLTTCTSPKQKRRMSTSWMECSIRQPPPVCATSARQRDA